MAQVASGRASFGASRPPQLAGTEPQAAALKTAPRKTWVEKMKGGGTGAPHVVTLPKPYCGAPAGGKMFIASPVLVDGYMRAVPRGETRTIEGMRRDLAKAHGADVTCPTSTSIFARIAAEAALEAMAAGASAESVAPFWRVVEPESPLAGRLSCGLEVLRRLRAQEADGSV